MPEVSNTKILFVIPQALEHDGSPAWWPLNIMEWAANFMQGEAAIAQLIRNSFPGLSEARERSLKLVEAVKELAGFPDYSKICVGGFSQGSKH